MNEPSVENTAHSGTVNPPTTVVGVLRRLGPGLIIAASIVGSGELIASTKTGAEAGFSLLWLILIGCLIKVFTQIEFGRFTITEGLTTIDGLNQIPGPRFRVNWLVWYWLFMFVCSTSQLGGIVGVVGQSLAIPFPITGDYRRICEEQKQYDLDAVPIREKLSLENPQISGPDLAKQVASELGPAPEKSGVYTWDDVYWSALVTVITAVMLVLGRYGLVQNVSTFLVASFTAVTIWNLFELQTYPAWSISGEDILGGLSFRLPETVGSSAPVATALATFGIIGVGSAELIAYPYWCLEKGYARFTGERDKSEGWAFRARGWLRVMQWDAWISMIVYTLATAAFYLLGAAVLFRAHKIPSDSQLIPTLSEMYRPVFGEAAVWMFLFGAFAVLYSTFFVATAGNARIAADGVRVFRLTEHSEQSRLWWTRLFCGLLPFLSLTVFVINKKPVTLVLISGLAQAVMLPMLGGAALYFRRHRCDPRICPGKVWDIMLWLSFFALIVTGVWGIVSNAQKIGGAFESLF
ncbi:MAG: Nramp family divalent metal transporter [Planctomycetota bacterium]|nr:Nramp family divalent metal transporter [Planctomycetota bacterium]